MKLRWLPLCLAALLILTESQAITAVLTDDATTDSKAAGVKFGKQPTLAVSSRQAAFLRFDLSPLPTGTLPTQISKATLRLFAARVANAGSVTLHAVTGDWSEKAIVASTQPGNEASIGQVDLEASDNREFVTFDVTSLVKAWVTTPKSNHGIVLKSTVQHFVATFDAKESASRGAILEIGIVSQGPQGIQGLQGGTGAKGDKGDVGAIGPKGDTGDQGVAGTMGLKGDRGEPGAPAVLPPALTQAFVNDGSPMPDGYGDTGIRAADWSVRPVGTTPFGIGYLITTGSALFGVSGNGQRLTSLDLAENTWAPDVNPTPGISDAALVGGPDGFIYCFGGVANSVAVANASRFDPSTGQTSPLNPMPGEKSSASAAMLDGFAYVFSGSNQATYSMNLATGQWQQLTPLPNGEAFNHAKMAVVAKKIYVITGTNRLFAFSPAANAWDLVTELPFGGNGAYPLPGGGSSVILFHPTQTQARLFRFDTTTGNLSADAVLPVTTDTFRLAEIINGSLVCTPNNGSGLLFSAQLNTFTRLLIRE